MRRISIFILCIFIYILTACSANNSLSEQSNEEDDIGKLLSSTSESRIIYNRYYQKMVLYNIKNNYIEKQSKSQNYFQYEFNTDSKYFTSGNSITNCFEILYVDGLTIKPIIKLADEKNQSIFPLTTDNEHKLFINVFYNKNGNEVDRKIVSLVNNSKLNEYKNTSGLISTGVILLNNLYYTIYNEKSMTYSLYKLDLSNYTNSPEFIEDNLSKPELYIHNKKIYKSDKNRIFCENDYFDKAPLNYFYDDYNILLQINSYGKGVIGLNVINTNTKEIIHSVENIIDYSIENGIVKVK
ncbi:MAG: hypothetical protein ACYDG2_02180 [Ruminiclostridium sp.]